MLTLKHIPVLFSEVMENLITNPEGIYVDGTFGRGGHSRGILERLKGNGRLLAFDRDLEAEKEAQKITDDRFSFVLSPFSQTLEIVKKHHIAGLVDGLLLDLGVSSPQFDDPLRGFSFLKNGPLDMRMDVTQRLSAHTFVNKAKEEELVDVFFRYGEEKFARKIAKAIVAKRGEKEIKTTLELAQIIKDANPRWEENKHPATRCFQAIRIYVNQEFSELEKVLTNLGEILKNNGRAAIISFHSLEYQIIKKFIQKNNEFKKKVTLKNGDFYIFQFLKRAIRATPAEIKNNVRSRSAILQVIEKVKI